jgi:hypothetical protein
MEQRLPISKHAPRHHVADGGTILLPLWHVGRMADSSIPPSSQVPVGVIEQRTERSSVLATIQTAD